MRLAIASLLGLVFCLPARPAAGVRVLMGVGDQAGTKWDGEVSVAGAKVQSVEPWRFDGADRMTGPAGWQMSVNAIRLFGGGQKRPAIANGVVVLLDGESEDAALNFKTAQGAFAVRLKDIPFGQRQSLLGGRVIADRVPAWTRITDSPDEQDYPAAVADKSSAIWVAYLEFKHHPEHNKIRNDPGAMEMMTARPGGDQLLLKRFAGGKWEAPIALTEGGGDLYRPAIAVDGRGRVWVFWSANEKGNFDLWARPVEKGKAGAAVRITSAPGSDIDPAAATDASGRVWVAWQGRSKGRGVIQAAVQNGNRFGAPSLVSSSAANEWNPAIAADATGKVTVAWDSYRNGNYDIFQRTAGGAGGWGPETAVAATPAYEAYPSLAYDPSGTLWVAHEEGGERWGKDFGAEESSGIALYQGRAIRLRGFTRDGRVVQAATDVGTALPGVPFVMSAAATPVVTSADVANRQSESEDWKKPATEDWKTRGDSRYTPNRQAPRNTMPRLVADSSGRLWLAIRSMHPVFWSAVGTVWTEYVAALSGSEWTGPIYIHHSDNLLDNRPALVAARAGELTVVGSSDGRRRFVPMSYMPGVRSSPAGDREAPADPYQNDLYLSRVTLASKAGAAAVKPGGPVTEAAKADPGDAAEAKAIDFMRKYRVQTKYGTLRILRGEFHRHSEISMDGGNDGSIIDQYRYMFDPSAMDWVGCCDHDNGGAREYSWWISQKLTEIFHNPGTMVSMFHYERSVSYPEGHRNVVFARRGVRPLPRLPRSEEEPVAQAADTQNFYAYLRKFDGIVASHTSATVMGTDWRDNDPVVEPVVEIYQGMRQNYEMPGAPRSNSEKDSIGGWRPKGFVNLALAMGYKMAFQASSDHISTHMSYCNVLATDSTREALLAAFKKRHVYGATDHIFAEFRCGDWIMGDSFSTSTAPALAVKLVGTARFAKVHVIRNSQYVYTTSPGTQSVEFTWRDADPLKGKTAYYYVRGEQEDGEMVWVSPMWIRYE